MDDLKVKLDTNQIFTEFFKLRDWKARSLGIGGLYLLVVLILIFTTFPIVFFGMGEVLLVALMIVFLILFSSICFLILQFYLAGYKLDIISVMNDNKEVENVPYLSDFGRRIIQGFKLSFSRGVYILIPTLFTFLGSFISSFSESFVATSGESMSEGFWGLLIIGYAVSGIGAILQFLTRLFFYPLLTARFVANDYRIGDTVNLSQVMNTMKLNIKELLIIGGLIFLTQFVFLIAFYMSGLLIFLCVGLFLFPVVLSVGTVYLQHFEARVVSNLVNSPIINEG